MGRRHENCLLCPPPRIVRFAPRKSCTSVIPPWPFTGSGTHSPSILDRVARPIRIINVEHPLHRQRRGRSRHGRNCRIMLGVNVMGPICIDKSMRVTYQRCFPTRKYRQFKDRNTRFKTPGRQSVWCGRTCLASSCTWHLGVQSR